MSQLTNFSENKLTDMVRAIAWVLGASLYAGLASAATDSAITELSGTGYGRMGITRGLTDWKSTQGNDVASTGTTHASSNSAAINWGTSGSAWGTANYVVLYDASTSGNPVAYFPITPQIIGNGVPVSVAAGALNFTFGLAGGCSDYLANKLIDFIFRGQAFTFPATMYEAAFTVAPTNAGGGTEVGGGGGYARVAIVGNTTNWSGTQAAGSTSASTGTGGEFSNNVVIQFPGPVTATWNDLVANGEYDASSGGNLLFWAELDAVKSVPSGASAPAFQAGARKIRWA